MSRPHLSFLLPPDPEGERGAAAGSDPAGPPADAAPPAAAAPAPGEATANRRSPGRPEGPVAALIAELRAYQAELEVQNKVLRYSQAAAESASERFETLFASVPLALIGSVAALWLAGQPLSVASMIGFITLTGIAARNGILKVSHTLNLALHEGVPFGPDLVVRASLERLTPVLMTALSAGIALVPLLYDAASPGKEILHPVAVAIFGGLVSATLLDALLTPVLILRFGRRPLERLMAARDAAPAGAAPADLY